MSILSSTDSSRFTACGFSSASTAITCLAIDACFGDAKGISTVLSGHGVLLLNKEKMHYFFHTYTVCQFESMWWYESTLKECTLMMWLTQPKIGCRMRFRIMIMNHSNFLRVRVGLSILPVSTLWYRVPRANELLIVPL